MSGHCLSAGASHRETTKARLQAARHRMMQIRRWWRFDDKAGVLQGAAAKLAAKRQLRRAGSL
jgi:hypothetical protein